MHRLRQSSVMSPARMTSVPAALPGLLRPLFPAPVAGRLGPETKTPFGSGCALSGCLVAGPPPHARCRLSARRYADLMDQICQETDQLQIDIELLVELILDVLGDFLPVCLHGLTVEKL